ncbi:anti-sigma factor [Priestia flexa]|uniref:anti-sigma factor n=1 Tax=Priestia flexa TaxID=86664 RepID=UPI001B33A01D|nr:anti-sigma factor [Priestia flexa]
MSMCDKLIDFYNGNLTPGERKSFQSHLQTCSSCQEELQELEEVLGDLAFLAAEQTPPPSMKERVLANVFHEEGQSSELSHHKEGIKQEKKLRATSRWMPLLAAALLFSLVGNGYLLLKSDSEQEVSGDPKQSQPATSIQTVTLQPANLKEGNAKASIVEDNGKVNVVIQASGLQQLQKDEVYQVWLIKGDKPVPAGAFVADENGNGTVIYQMTEEQRKQQWDTMAITLEPNANNELPQGDIVLSSVL